MQAIPNVSVHIFFLRTVEAKAKNVTRLAKTLSLVDRVIIWKNRRVLVSPQH